MKKNFKKLSSLALAFLLVFSLSLSAFAADISLDKAKQIALKDAGYKESQVSRLVANVDYDDGVKYYDVQFIVSDGEGYYYEYEYEVKAADGRILEKDVEKEKAKAKVNAEPEVKKQASVKEENKNLSKNEAKKAALDYFKVKEADVKFIELHKEYDDGVQVYNVEFCKPYSVKYSCEVVVASGKVRDAEKENVNSLEDKFELFFGVLFYKLFN